MHHELCQTSGITCLRMKGPGIEPTVRLRLTREYQADGSWAQSTWIKEEKVL